MKKLLLVLGVLFSMLFACAVQAAPQDDLVNALNLLKNPTGHYLIDMEIPFQKLDTMRSNTSMDIQANPFCMRAYTTTLMGKQEPTKSTLYEVMEGQQLKTYSQKVLKKDKKTNVKTWVYDYSDIEGGAGFLSTLNPSIMVDSVKSVREISNSGTTQHLEVVFDGAKMFAKPGVSNSVKASGSADTEKDFEKVMEDLRKSGDIKSNFTIVNGRITHVVADISAPVKAFDKVLVKGLNRKAHGGALGGWLLGMLFSTGRSTLTVSYGVLQESISVPADVKKSAILDPEPDSQQKKANAGHK